MHWFVCNDARKVLRNNVNIGGSALRSGRFYLYYGTKRSQLKAHWSFWNNLRWLETYVRLGGEDRDIYFGLILPQLAYVGFGFTVPHSWLERWMAEDRVFSLKVGYVHSILRLCFAYAQHMEDCGMTGYYRRNHPERYTKLQLWPGYEFVLRFPPVLDWLFGRATRHDPEILDQREVEIEMDGKVFPATWTLQRYVTTRPRWPWEYRIWIGSDLRVENPPRFAGKGENSWDCGDDGIWGMGSRELTPAGAIGDYIKAVLKNRERYGMPSKEEEKADA